MLGTAKIITLLHAAILAISGDVQAQNNYSSTDQIPTIVEATAQTPNGSKNTFIIEQPADAPNPLGDPIATQSSPENQSSSSQNLDSNSIPSSNVQKNEDTSNSNQPPQNPGNKFQNTLLEANGMVYDIQAFPKSDIPLIENPSNPQTIYSPNVNP